MGWSWDERKAKANLAKHGIAFDLALRVFDDPLQISDFDPHPDGDRWRTIGLVRATTMVVIHTLIEPDGTGRIISARKATPSERKMYEQRYH